MDYDSVSTFVSEDVYNAFAPSAVDTLAQYLCFNPLATSQSVDGIVGENGMSVTLPLWASSVTRVEYDGSELSFTFVPNVGDFQINETPVSYAATLMIQDDCLTPGAIVTVTGEFGFATMPSSLLPVLGYIMKAFYDYSTGANRVTSKSIEDVSVSMNSEENPLTQLATVYAGTLKKWSLCAAYRTPNGTIATDPALPDKPWWVTDDDLNIIGG